MSQLVAAIDSSRCVGCGACMEQCPVHAIRMLPGWVVRIDPQQCVGCGRCVSLCHRKAPNFVSHYQNHQ